MASLTVVNLEITQEIIRLVRKSKLKGSPQDIYDKVC